MLSVPEEPPTFIYQVPEAAYIESLCWEQKRSITETSSPTSMMTDETRSRRFMKIKRFARAAQMRADVILKYQNFPHQDPYEHIQLDSRLTTCELSVCL